MDQRERSLRSKKYTIKKIRAMAVLVVKWSVCSPYTQTFQVRSPPAEADNFSVNIVVAKIENKQN